MRSGCACRKTSLNVWNGWGPCASSCTCSTCICVCGHHQLQRPHPPRSPSSTSAVATVYQARPNTPRCHVMVIITLGCDVGRVFSSVESAAMEIAGSSPTLVGRAARVLFCPRQFSIDGGIRSRNNRWVRMYYLLTTNSYICILRMYLLFASISHH